MFKYKYSDEEAKDVYVKLKHLVHTEQLYQESSTRAKLSPQEEFAFRLFRQPQRPNEGFGTIKTYSPPEYRRLPTAPKVLPLHESYSTASARRFGLFYDPKSAFEQLNTPLSHCVNKNYFIRPYESGESFLHGLISGLFLPAATILLSPAFAMVYLPSIFIELGVGLAAMFQAAYYLSTGNRRNAELYAWDALSRILLSCALFVVIPISIPFEMVRFFTRSLVTMMVLTKQCVGALSKESDALGSTVIEPSLVPQPESTDLPQTLQL
jgi:hypothetical protein